MNVGLVGGCAGSGCAGSLHGKRERGEFGEDDKMDDFFTQMPSFSNSHGCHSLALLLFATRYDPRHSFTDKTGNP